MRSRKAANEHVAEVARKRLELLSAELAQAARPGPETMPPERVGQEPSEQTQHLQRERAVAGARTPVRPEPTQPSSPPAVVPRPGRHARRSVGPRLQAAAWLHDRLPPTLQGRVQIGSTHLTVVALLVAAALAVTAWWVIRADGGTVVPAAVSPAASAARSSSFPLDPAESAVPVVDSAAQPPGDPPPTGSPVVVDVAGKVRRPGIATLPAGSRVVDALKAAGGARRGVDLTSLNLARLLVDGEQIVVGVPPPAGVAAPAASAPGVGASTGPLVNINSAAQAELETLPGVGPVTAQAILQWRSDNGAFTSVDELLEVSGIGDATLAEMAPFVTI